MAPGDYASVGSGKLKLKGVKDSKVDKKKKKKSKQPPPSALQKDENVVVGQHDDDGDDNEHDDEGDDRFQDRSVMLKNLHDEDEKMAKDERNRKLGV